MAIGNVRSIREFLICILHSACACRWFVTRSDVLNRLGRFQVGKNGLQFVIGHFRVELPRHWRKQWARQAFQFPFTNAGDELLFTPHADTRFITGEVGCIRCAPGPTQAVSISVTANPRLAISARSTAGAGIVDG